MSIDKFEDLDLSVDDLKSEFEIYESPFHATEEPVEASKSLAKTRMVIFLRDIIERAGWTQAEAAKHLEVDPARVSNLMRGKIDLFTIDYLITLMDRLKVPVLSSYKEDGSLCLEIKMPQSA